MRDHEAIEAPVGADDAADLQVEVDPARRQDLERALVRGLPQIRSVIRRIVHNPARVEELAHDTVVCAYMRLHTFNGRCAMITWLCSIAKFLSLNDVRRRTEVLVESGQVDWAPEGTQSALQRLTERERQQMVQRALDACLDALDRQVFDLRYREQLDCQEIERRLAIDTATGARGALFRIRRKMERELARRMKEMGHGASFVHTQAI